MKTYIAILLCISMIATGSFMIGFGLGGTANDEMWKQAIAQNRVVISTNVSISASIQPEKTK